MITVLLSFRPGAPMTIKLIHD